MEVADGKLKQFITDTTLDKAIDDAQVALYSNAANDLKELTVQFRKKCALMKVIVDGADKCSTVTVEDGADGSPAATEA